MSRKKVRFDIQSTKSFCGGAPQREGYETDMAFIRACVKYSAEWRREYQCTGCSNQDCPQHGQLRSLSEVESLDGHNNDELAAFLKRTKEVFPLYPDMSVANGELIGGFQHTTTALAPQLADKVIKLRDKIDRCDMVLMQLQDTAKGFEGNLVDEARIILGEK